MNNCNCNNNDCGCVMYNGRNIIYTGVNITEPFAVPRGTNFNEFVKLTTEYLANSTSFVTVSYDVTPSDATVTINGEVTNSLSVLKGSNVTVSITRSGYLPYNETFAAPLIDTAYDITLQAVPTLNFDYFWGEIGNIFASEPYAIQEANWDNLIKPNGTSGGMNFYENANALQNSYEKEPTGGQLQWWIMLVPTSETTITSQIPDYTWKVFNQLSNSFENYTGMVYPGVVTLDSVEYLYSAIRPLSITKIQYSKNVN